MSGEITGDLGPARPLAVAVNDVIAAVVYTWPSGDDVRYTAMLPPAGFRRGSNSVRLYALSGNGESATLSALFEAARSAPTGVARIDGKTAIRLPGRAAIPIVPRSTVGL